MYVSMQTEIQIEFAFQAVNKVFFFKHPTPLFLFPETVRLVGGPNRCSGRLEVKTGPSWASVCQFNSKEAQVTCGELGCGFPLEVHSKYYSNPLQNTEHTLSPVFNCGGKEKHLLDCPSTTINATEEGCGMQRINLICTGKKTIQMYPKFYALNILFDIVHSNPPATQ